MNRDDLKNRIKNLAEQGRTLRGKIQATAGPERHALWNQKRAIRQEGACVLAGLRLPAWRALSTHRAQTS
jgi:hypothetical protein